VSAGRGSPEWRERELHRLDALSGAVNRLRAEGNPRAEQWRRRIEILRIAVELVSLGHA
jgi:hypothetical protein